MERTEPTLVPEWLRCTMNVGGGGGSSHHSDVSRSRYSRSNSTKDSPRYFDRSSSNSKRSSSSNGSTKHPYSSFSRSRWDKTRDREKEKPLSRDAWDHDSSSDPLSSVLSRFENSGMRRSQSLVSRKPGEPFLPRAENSRISSLTQKAVFEKDFPSLGIEEKQGVTGIKRVLSPGLNSALQSLPISNSGFLGGEKWTSALVEVPPSLANNCTGQSFLAQSDAVTISSSSSRVSSTACPNMAEALSQPAARAHTNFPKPDKSERLEELAIKQSRQLIPMTPPMPKPLVPSSSDKSKQSKTAVRNNNTAMASRGVHPQPHPSHHANQSRSVRNKSDPIGTSHVGKFLVLKPGREIMTPGARDGFRSDANGSSRVNTDDASNPSSNSVVSLENEAAALTISSRSTTTDKKPIQSLLAKSRSEFFNLMRRKASSSSVTTGSDPRSSDVLPSIDETSAEIKEGGSDLSSRGLENGDVGDISSSGDGGSIYPDEEEAAFLRSLGWDENGGEDEGLTEEEINAFYQEYMNRRPPMELSRSSEPNCSTMSTRNIISGGRI